MENFELPHIIGISKAANFLDQLIIFRDISDSALKLKEEGVHLTDKDGQIKHSNVSTKDIRVKAKSAGKGPFAGLIPRRAINSKIGDKLRECTDPAEKASVLAKIKETDEKTQRAIEAGEFTVVTAVINGEKMEVLADEGGNPFTADYDILTHTTHNKSKSENDKNVYLNKTMGYTTVSTSSLILEIIDNIKDEDIKAGKIDKNHIHKSISRLNKGKTTTEVSHGADYLNPNPDILSITEDRPLTVFTPKGQIFKITSNKKFVEFAGIWAKRGYKIPANKGWGIEFYEGSVDYVDINEVDKNKELGFKNIKTTKDFWKRNLKNVERELAEMGKMEDNTPNKRTNVLALEVAKAAIEHDLDNDKESAEIYWGKLENLDKLYQKRNNNELSPVGKLVAKKQILQFHEASISDNKEEIEKAAANIFKNKNAVRMLKESVNQNYFKEIVALVKKYTKTKNDEDYAKQYAMRQTKNSR